jgi:hypothetical protein
MGMDVYGKKPTAEIGEYFRNNVWYWRPLWEYCCHIEPTLIQKVPNAHYNDGDGLNSKDASQLGFKLAEEISSGRAQKYVEEYEKIRQAIPKEDCKYCDEKGQREWAQQDGTPIKKTCNACSGTKKVDSWESHYPMDLDNIKEFSQFLQHCGGFQIC